MRGATWCPIPGYEGRYAISDEGRVRSMDRIDAKGHLDQGVFLKPSAKPSGHLRVTLSRDGVARRFWVHRLVLEAFVGARPDGMQACHNDGNPSNNLWSNLRWDTASANAIDRQRHGTDAQSRKTHCPQEHEYTADNTYYSAKGYRHCRTCTLAGQREHRIRKNEEKAIRNGHL